MDISSITASVPVVSMPEQAPSTSNVGSVSTVSTIGTTPSVTPANNKDQAALPQPLFSAEEVQGAIDNGTATLQGAFTHDPSSVAFWKMPDGVTYSSERNLATGETKIYPTLDSNAYKHASVPLKGLKTDANI